MQELLFSFAAASYCPFAITGYRKKAADHILHVRDRYLGRIVIGQNCFSFSFGYVSHMGWLYRLNSGGRHKYMTDSFFSPQGLPRGLHLRSHF